MALTSERGQMLLIGAITIAVLFISLSLVLNGSIHTTTIASEASADTATSETIALQDSLHRDVTTLITAAIREHPDTYLTQQSAASSNVTALGERYSEYYAQQDRIVSFGSTSVNEGRRIGQSSGEFTDTSGSPDWEVSSSTELRRFNIDVSGWGTSADRFTIEVATDWRIEIYESGSGAVIDVYDDTSLVGSCSASATPRIGVTNATVDGDPCAALKFLEEFDSSYRVQFKNGDGIEGSYGLISSDTLTSGPNREKIIYSVEVELQERSSRIDYTSIVEIAPGEPT